MKPLALLLTALVCLISWRPLDLQAASPTKDGVAFFENKIRPVLVKHCYACHSVEARKNKKLRGGLLLDSREGILAGGDSGKVLIPGKSKDSLLVHAVRYESTKMPPKQKLADDVIADIAKWVDMGAPDPRDESVLPAKRKIDIADGKKHWAFRPLVRTEPQATTWGRNPIDGFVFAKLQAKSLTPARPLDRARLLRRVAFDLVGLPPTAEEIQAFVEDTSPDAYGKVIDRLLQSKHHGERWARHWLDVARFAESGGYEFDKDRPGAYQFRDFVIQALNADMPYDEFVRLQLAGDYLKPRDFGANAATGFLVAGPYPGQTTAKTREIIRYDHLDDMLSTVGTAMLGLSVGCARCHEHKFDPIPQQDYYHLLATLGRTDSAEMRLDTVPERTRLAREAFDKVHAPIVAVRDKFVKEELPARLAKWAEGMQVPEWLTLAPVSTPAMKGDTLTVVAQTSHKGLAALRVDPRVVDVSMTAALSDGKAKPVAVKLGTRKGTVVPVETPINYETSTLTITLRFEKGKATKDTSVAFTTLKTAKPDGEAKPQLAFEVLNQRTNKNRDVLIRWFRKVDARTNEVFAAVEASLKNEPQPKLEPVFVAASGRGGDVHYLIRGEVERKNGVAKVGFMQVLTNESRPMKASTPPRVALAEWITDAEQGAGHLLARVIVNRLWQHHFGKGLVRTPNDFGAQGEPPTHPELLDYLASELIRQGWRLKPIHRLIVSSAAYQQGGEVTPEAQKVDPDNLLWGRVPPRRLEAEAIRDALLSISDAMDTRSFGPGTLDENNPRRSVYLTNKRSRQVPLMIAFDAPEGIQSVGERQSTTTTSQALFMMNSPFVRRSAEGLMRRIHADKSLSMPGAIESAYMQALGRRPTTQERDKMLGFVTRASEPTKALADVCQVLLCLNEFIFVD